MPRFGLKGFGLVAVAVAAVVVLLTAGTAAAAFHGLGVAKGCNDFTPVYGGYTCQYQITNNVDSAGNTYTFDSVVDVVAAHSGAVTSANLMSSVEWVVTAGAATCTGGSGAGTIASPYVGVSFCTLPTGAQVTSNPFSFYTVQPADYTNAGHVLSDLVTVGWTDTTISLGGSNQGPAETTVTQNPSQTATSIEGGAVQAAGSSVSDDVTVSAGAGTPPGSPPPDGTVTVSFFSSSTCDPASQVGSSATATLDSNGQALGVLPEGPLAAGLYGYKAVYNGSNAYTGSTGDCEPLRIVDANIQISPNGTNRVGQTHTFTGHVNVNDGTGSANAPDGTLISFSIDSGPGSFVGGVNTCTTSGGTGSCTVQITSAVTGVTTVSAHTTLAVDTVSLTRNTDGTGGNSGPATKTWVNAKISIAPTATNEVGHSHMFTVTVMKDTGTGTFVAAAGEPVTVTCTASNGAAASGPFTGTTDGSGQFQVTVNSSTTGSLTCHASSTISDLGTAAPFTVATDGVAPNSGDATKTWVDANIQISPASATDPINDNHTLTGHVNVDNGSGSGEQNAPAGTLITFSIVSGPGSFVGGVNTCTTIGTTGSCTVQITSATAGTTVIHASTDVTVGGVSLHRETDGTGTNSGNAQKTWVAPDANIQISPASATDPVGDNHTLTGHVNISTDSVTFTNAPAGTLITFSIVSGPGSFVGGVNTCTTIGTTGSCTVQITSAVAGTTVIRAATDVTVSGVSLHRETNDGHVGDSSDANKTWVPPGGLIAPTQTTCNDVLNGTASTLGQINYSVTGGGKIGQGINPGVFFFYSKITTTVPNQVVTVSQTNTSTNNAALFGILNGQAWLWSGDCSSKIVGSVTGPNGSGASFTVPSPGNYIIGIKYSTKTIAGTTAPVPANITYNFNTSLGGSTGASVLLAKQ